MSRLDGPGEGNCKAQPGTEDHMSIMILRVSDMQIGKRPLTVHQSDQRRLNTLSDLRECPHHQCAHWQASCRSATLLLATVTVCRRDAGSGVRANIQYAFTLGTTIS